MAQMLTIPYARQQPYDQSAYVRAMSDLMLRRGEAIAQARLARGASTQNAWNQFGDIAMSTFAGIGKQRDEELKLAALQAERDREYALKQQEMKDRAEEREEARAERETTRREGRAKEFTDRTNIGTAITPATRERILAGTGSAAAFDYQPAQAARLPATPMADMMGLGGYSDAGGITDFAQMRKPSMSADTAATPEQYVRTPDTQEALAIANLERQEQALASQNYRAGVDDRRQAQALQVQMANIAADNLRANQARRDSAEARRDAMELRRFIAGATQDQHQLSNMFALSNAVKGHPAYTKMLDFESGLQAVETGLNQGNGLGDIAAINAFQRLVDPGVSVREGDVRLLESAIALGSKLNPAFWADKLSKGDRLPEPMRLQMQQAARDLYVARTKTYNETVGDTYKQQAAQAKIPFSLIGRDFPIPDFSKPTTPATPGGGGFWDRKPPGSK